MNTEDTELIKSYLKRLSDGEDLESVRKDFSEKFRDADPQDIMDAEQAMIDEGAPLEKVQKLCDIHSALFHGEDTHEDIRSLQQKNAVIRKERAEKLIKISGHPLSTFTKENIAIKKVLSEAENADRSGIVRLLPKIRQIGIHYAKKGDLLYPVLKVNYNIPGPSEVMWTVDDEIRKELAVLAGDAERKGGEVPDSGWEEKARSVFKRAEEMVFKEDNILFQICAVQFSDEDWKRIYRDSKDYDECLGVVNEVWKDAEAPSGYGGAEASAGTAKENTDTREISKTASVTAENRGYGGFGIDMSKAEINMPGGHMNLEQLTAVLNTIPMEISFVDENNINCFFNEGPKVFKRPQMAIGREVFSCHPPKVAPMVRSIIESFRSGKKDEVPVWMEKNGRSMLVRYMAVRDRDGRYLGTMELVQDMEFAKKHFE